MPTVWTNGLADFRADLCHDPARNTNAVFRRRAFHGHGMQPGTADGLSEIVLGMIEGHFRRSLDDSTKGWNY